MKTLIILDYQHTHHHQSRKIKQSSSTTKKKQDKNKKDTHTSKNSESLRVLTIHFQSNKTPEVEFIIESCKPSIIFGTETWLPNGISPYEYIPSSKYNIYTKNRKDGWGSITGYLKPADIHTNHKSRYRFSPWYKLRKCVGKNIIWRQQVTLPLHILSTTIR